MSENKSKPVDKIFPIESGLKAIGNCPICSVPIKENEFRDMLSEREYKISGLCQSCQDKIFGV